MVGTLVYFAPGPRERWVGVPEAKGRGVRRSTLPYLSRWILEATCLKISVSQRGKRE